MSLGERIQELRRQHAMSQDTLAEKLEVSRQAVSKWERDEAIPETEKILRIAQAFGVSTDYLLLGEQPPQVPASAGQAGGRLERMIRRHGYKVGYVMVGAGAFLCLLAVLVTVLLPEFGSGVLDSMGTQSTDNWFMMDDFWDQQVNQIGQNWARGVSVIAALFSVPTLAGGIALIVLGIIVIRKGKKLAAATP